MGLATISQSMEGLVERAREIAVQALKDDFRGNGHSFIEHPDGVAGIVRDEIGLGDTSIAAIYLHEASRFHPEVDLSGFPQEVRNIVDGLTRISFIKPKDTRLEAENYKKLIVQYSSDPRITVIKIADRLEILRNISLFPKGSRDQKLLETLMLYIPLAHQLGLYNIKSEMENIYFRYSDPEQYRLITNKLKATEKDREKLSREFVEPLKKTLSDAGINYKLKVRTKTAYSIYKKMQKQKVDFDGVYDVFAIRFIIDCQEDRKTEQDLCWKVYSYVTEEYEPDTSRLRDWLTNPKPNGYESLHITVKNKEGNYLEVQIRTKRMDDIAESGLASHWSYKGIKSDSTLDSWLNSVRYNLEHKATIKQEDIPQPPEKEIFVFTPSGELKILPAGATVLDFAYCIHSGLGSRCTGAIIGNRNVPIKEKLATGDVVEILSNKNQKPSYDWLNWVVSTKARTRIKLELNDEERRKAAEGREILERRLRNWKLEFPDDMRAEYMKRNRFSSVIAMMAAIADETIDINELKDFILKFNETPMTQEEKSTSSTTKEAIHGEDILVINAKNVKGLDYKMAHCCNPVFGDDVFGFVTRTDGIKIHRLSCPNAARLLEKYPYRIQRVVWQETSSSGEFICNLKVLAHQDHTVLATVMDSITAFRVSLKSFNVKEDSSHGTYEISIRLLVPSNTELDKVTSRIGKSQQIIKVKRL